MNNVVHNTAWIPGHFHTTVGGPTFLAFIGMGLFLVSELTGKPVRLPRLNVWVPYLWLIGVLVFSLGLSVSGLLGAPRRSNLGPTYANPDSPLFHPTWMIWSHIGMLGGIIMTVAMLAYFVVFFATLFGAKERAAALRFPTAEAYHDGDLGMVRNFTPWVLAAVVLLVIAYVPPIWEAVAGPVQRVPGYTPSSPVVAK